MGPKLRIGERMRIVTLACFACCMTLAGCFDSSPKLSNEDEQLFDAVMYAFTGIEDNTRDIEQNPDPYGLTAWKKEPTANGFRFTMIGRNGIVSSNAEFNKKIRQSKYVKYVYRLTSKERCVFRFENFDEFSKGDSQTEFIRVDESVSLGGSGTFNLGSAHKFELVETETIGRLRRFVVLEGPKVMCQEEFGEYCKNKWIDESFGGADRRFDSDDGEVDRKAFRRRGRAVELIKKACPGKAF
jgi:hypothetical protein